MNDVILSEQDALLRATDEQVSVLLGFYEDPFQVEQQQLNPAFIERRRQSLGELRNVLRRALAERDLLPKQQDTEVSAWHFLVDRVRGLLRDEPLAVPLAEERRLLELCDALVRGEPHAQGGVYRGTRDTEQAVRHLEQPDD